MKKIEVQHDSWLEKKAISQLSHIGIIDSQKPIGFTFNTLALKQPVPLVENGSIVKIGTPLLTDREFPFIRYLSPGSGKILFKETGFSIERMQSTYLEYQPFKMSELKNCTKKQVCHHIIQIGFWHYFRILNTEKIPDPETLPSALYISLQNDEPEMPNADLLFKDKEAVLDFELALSALEKISPLIHVAIPANAINLKLKLRQFITHEIEGDYPANQPGVFSYYVNKNESKNAWTMAAQDVVRMGSFLRTGHYPVEKIIKLSGIETKGTGCFWVKEGTCIKDIQIQFNIPDPYQIILGGLISGLAVDTSETAHVGPYHSALSFIAPSPPYLPEPMIDCIGCGHCAKSCAVELQPQFIYKKIMTANRVDQELDHCVFCGLCTLVCPSHIPLQALFKKAKLNTYDYS